MHNKTKFCLKQAEAVIIIQDREGDNFEQFVSVPDEKTYFTTTLDIFDGCNMFKNLGT